MGIQTAERISFSKASDNVMYQRHLISYEYAKKYVKGCTLEIGCGEAYGIKMLSEFADKYVAVDKFLAELSENQSKKDNVEFHQMTVPPLTFDDNIFDAAVSFHVIEHIEDDNAFVSETSRVLKKGGQALITTPNRLMSLTRNPWHVREYTALELKNMFSKYFSQVEVFGLFGNEKVKEYYQRNKESVEKITRFDIFNLQYNLPRQFLQIPYDILNRWNRRKLLTENNQLTSGIGIDDYYFDEVNDECLDILVIATK